MFYLRTSTLRPSLRIQLLHRTARHLSTSSPSSASSPFASRPSPPPLPKEEQARFEDLQRASTGAFSTPRIPIKVNQSPASSTPSSTADLSSVDSPRSPSPASNIIDIQKSDDVDYMITKAKAIKAEGEGEELHPDIRRGARPEFEGDVNPLTGEVGGPKNEPLRWGGSGDWSYNGRCTDF